MIDIKAAAQLLDFGARIGPGQRAQEQLDGAVAIHNILSKQRVAYLADEVGMGKTYVALGAMALFRHFNPAFRVAVIAPRENIQHKWIKELRNFVDHNMRYQDLRVKALHGGPARDVVACSNLVDFVRQVTLRPERDFFLRLTSFSLPLAGKGSVDPDAAKRLRQGLREFLPWIEDGVFDLRNKQAFKDNIARAICCAIPEFDLLIVDEAHNLKHGFQTHSAARNRVLSLVFGHPRGKSENGHFPGYAPRAKRVLFLSATPIEETYAHLWNQLDVFARGEDHEDLKDPHSDEANKKASAARFLLRRVTSINIGGEKYTKNLYRREWRRGGVSSHDNPITVKDPRQRLTMALVQKKVSELLGHERFGGAFQIGMLASFESFLETAKLKRTEEELGNFDDTDQTEDELEREGLDVRDLNKLARDYRHHFNGAELPHPKMDEVVNSLSDAWITGRKGLVFVRRVASVREIKRKLDVLYDKWLIDKLRRGLPAATLPRFEEVVAQYGQIRLAAIERASEGNDPHARRDQEDKGGMDTFFAWFFRGEGPKGYVSGANVQKRFVQSTSAYSTFFEDNTVAQLLDCRPSEVLGSLGNALGVGAAELREGIRRRARRYLSRAKTLVRGDRFEAAQAAAVEWLKEGEGTLADTARVVWQERYANSLQAMQADEAPELTSWLETPTFFTALRERPDLRARLWPDRDAGTIRDTYREQELRRQLLATAARLGHSFIDLYLYVIGRIGGIEAGSQDEGPGEDDPNQELNRVSGYLDILEAQMATPIGSRAWGAFDELAEMAENFDLILDVNDPEARERQLSESARGFGALLRQQQPIGGMAGQVNQTLVRQFRLPGYPLVLISTDLLQEGEDLHTFCSDIHHYGISWTPSSMEQRIGRIDRVRSQTDRRLGSLQTNPDGDQLLQVFYPYLPDTVEILQVQRVLERMNVFLRLMHEGLIVESKGERRLDVGREMINGQRIVEQIKEPLRSSFPVTKGWLRGDRNEVAVGPSRAETMQARFERLRDKPLPGLDVRWEPDGRPGEILGTVLLGDRVQAFSIELRSVRERLLVHCISPIGRITDEHNIDELAYELSALPLRLVLSEGPRARWYDLSVEESVLLAGEEHDAARVSAMIARVVRGADELELRFFDGRDALPEKYHETVRKGGDASQVE